MTYDSKKNASIQEQAAEWLIDLAEPNCEEGQRRAFMRWLKTSPQHIEEFLAVAALQQDLADVPSSVDDILAELGSPDAGRAVPLFDSADTRPPKAANDRRRLRLPGVWAAAAGLALAALLMTRMPLVEPPETSHSTGLGEQRSIALSDGSLVTLNTLSEVSLHFDSDRRHVTLLRGEALFDVAKDARRPFVVDTGTVSLSVLGTKFSVYRGNDWTRVAVVDGTVSAVSTRAPDNPVIVRAGEGAVATSQGVRLRDGRFDVQQAIAWTERRLIFDEAPLAEVVAEFNRYNRVPLVVEDSELASRAVTTVFNAHDVPALIGFLELEPDVEVDYGEESIRIRVRH